MGKVNKSGRESGETDFESNWVRGTKVRAKGSHITQNLKPQGEEAPRKGLQAPADPLCP